jgi:histidinol phosphatase-like PHP family hydrolase
MIWSSWHNHTGDGPRFSYCADADLTPEVYRCMLRQGPWRAFALTEHAFALGILPDEEPWPPQWYHRPERLWANRALREDKTIRFLERLHKTCDGEKIFGGLEVEVACDGSLSMEPMLWPYLHVVIGSIHYLPGDPRDQFTEHLHQLGMLLHYPIDILGHPFRAFGEGVAVPDEIIDETLLRVKEVGVAIEINAHVPFARDAYVLVRAVHLGVRVAFGLDSHARHELQLHTYFEQILRDSGVECSQIRHFQPARKVPKPRVLVR